MPLFRKRSGYPGLGGSLKLSNELAERDDTGGVKKRD